MYIVRDIFTAKPGQAGKLAKLFKRAFGNEPNSRVMTDIIGNYNTVVMEMQVESLADWERQFNEYKSGNMGDLDPQLLEELKNYTELWETGRREMFQVIE